MIRDILIWPDPRLATRCDPVEVIDESIKTLVQDMFDTMYAAPGRGLAAPQIGTLKRVFVMDVGWKDGDPTPLAMINPVIDWYSDELSSGDEGCLSIPGVMANIARPAEVRISWTDLDGKKNSRVFDGFASTCAQHEYDHLDGIVTFDRVSSSARETLEQAYGA